MSTRDFHSFRREERLNFQDFGFWVILMTKIEGCNPSWGLVGLSVNSYVKVWGFNKAWARVANPFGIRV